MAIKMVKAETRVRHNGNHIADIAAGMKELKPGMAFELPASYGCSAKGSVNGSTVVSAIRHYTGMPFHTYMKGGRRYVALMANGTGKG